MPNILRHLYVRVLIATLFGVVLALIAPETAVDMKVLGDAFIALIKMIIGPVVFCTVVLGIAATGDLRKVGRVSMKALVYFEVVSTIALILGLLIVNTLKPGASFHADPLTLDTSAVASYAEKARETSFLGILRNIIPSTMTDAFSGSGDLLQILLIAVLFGFALSQVGPRAFVIRDFIEGLSHVLFKMVGLVMQFAPIGAFGAMAFTIGKYGIKSFGPLFALMGSFYLTCLIFIFVVLGLVARWVGFSMLSFIRYIRAELLTVLGTSSSESALVPLMEKLEKLGCERSTVGLVIPAGYSFNLDGTNIYLTMAAIFIAQALGIDLTISQQLTLLLVAVLTSKGASGVTGAGFITLAATLAAVPGIPVAGLALILGIDRFMSEARALTNIIGNGVATMAVSKWENELDVQKMREELKS